MREYPGDATAVPESKPPDASKPEDEREIEYLVCLDCNTPCYDFEMQKKRLVEALCTMCGNEDTLRFQLTEDEDE
jgi:hypothetical protein